MACGMAIHNKTLIPNIMAAADCNYCVTAAGFMVSRCAVASICLGRNIQQYFHIIAGNKESQAREGSRLCSKA